MNALIIAVLCLASPAEVRVALKSRRFPVTRPAKAKGNDFLEHRLTLGNLRLWHRVAVDPKKGDEPVRFGYGEFFFGCEFGRQGNGGWNIWHFTSAAVADPRQKGKPVGLYRRVEGFHVVERGPRAIADVVWWLDGGPRQRPDDLVTMRFVKRAAEPEWCFIETSVESGAPLTLAKVSYSAFPAQTSGPPGRERWVTTAARAHNLMPGGVDLDPKREWAISLHNKHAYERAGSLLVFDPGEIARVRVEGTYGVDIQLTPKPGCKRVRVAVSYFLRQHYAEANAAFLQAAPRARERLRRVSWDADLSRVAEAWDGQMAEMAEPLAQAGVRSSVGERIDKLTADYEAALAQAQAARSKGQPVPRRLQRHVCGFLARLEALRQDVFAAAVKAMLEENK